MVPSLEATPTARAATAAPAAHAATLRAVNLSRGDYYNSLFPFTDLIKTSSRGWNPNTWADAEGWLRSLPPGKEAHCWVVLHLDPVHGTFAPGDYVISSSSKATLSLVTLSPELTGRTKGGVGRAEFTVLRREDGDYRRLSIGVRCRNDTSRPIDVTDLVLNRLAARRESESFPEFHPSWLATNRGTALVRAMDWAEVNNSPVVSAAQLPTPSSRSWSKGVPYAVHARAAAALQADLWVCVPHGGQNHRYVCSAATGTFSTPKAHDFADGAAIVFVDYGQGRTGLPQPLEYGRTYYATACSGADFQVAERPGGPAMALQSDVGPANYSRVSSALGIEGLSRLFETIAEQVASALSPETQVFVEYSNEVWNYSFLQAHFVRQYVARLGGAASASASGYGVGSLLAWRAFEKVLGRQRVKRVFCAQSAWFESLAAGLDHVDRGIVSAGETVGRIADVYAIAPYVTPRDERGKALSIQGLVAANAAAWSDAEWDAAFDRHIAALSSGVAAHIAKARERNGKLQFTSYECGQHLAEAIPRDIAPADAQALQRRYLRYLDGQAGAEMYRRYYEKVFVENGLRHFTHFTDAGGYTSNRHLFQWGLKRSHLDPDNARGAFFRSLPTR